MPWQICASQAEGGVVNESAKGMAARSISSGR